MPQIRNVFFGVLFFGVPAVSLLLGAVQLASGRDLGAGTQVMPDQPAISVNRAAKADRIAGPMLAAPTRTISLRHTDLADMSVVIRIPITTREVRPPTLRPAGTPNRQPTIACEPVVSVLTEVAKRLQPVRCLS